MQEVLLYIVNITITTCPKRGLAPLNFRIDSRRLPPPLLLVKVVVAAAEAVRPYCILAILLRHIVEADESCFLRTFQIVEEGVAVIRLRKLKLLRFPLLVNLRRQVATVRSLFTL